MSAALGRPRPRKLASNPSCCAERQTYASSPSGAPRPTHCRTRSHSASVIGASTASTRPAPRGTGPGSSRGIPAGRPRLDHGHASARATRPARSAFRSTVAQHGRDRRNPFRRDQGPQPSGLSLLTTPTLPRRRHGRLPLHTDRIRRRRFGAVGGVLVEAGFQVVDLLLQLGDLLLQTADQRQDGRLHLRRQRLPDLRRKRRRIRHTDRSYAVGLCPANVISRNAYGFLAGLGEIGGLVSCTQFAPVAYLPINSLS